MRLIRFDYGATPGIKGQIVNLDHVVNVELFMRTTITGKPKEGERYKDIIILHLTNGQKLTLKGDGVYTLMKEFEESGMKEYPFFTTM